MQVQERETKVSDAEASVIQAEERSSAAMLTAEGAVLDEMEVTHTHAVYTL